MCALRFPKTPAIAARYQGRYVALHQSTLREVDVIANIAGRAHDRNLKTNTRWWDLRGGSVKAFVDWINSIKS